MTSYSSHMVIAAQICQYTYHENLSQDKLLKGPALYSVCCCMGQLVTQLRSICLLQPFYHLGELARSRWLLVDGSITCAELLSECVGSCGRWVAKKVVY